VQDIHRNLWPETYNCKVVRLVLSSSAEKPLLSQRELLLAIHILASWNHFPVRWTDLLQQFWISPQFCHLKLDHPWCIPPVVSFWIASAQKKVSMFLSEASNCEGVIPAVECWTSVEPFGNAPPAIKLMLVLT
jgi:hypothetical protein